MAPKLDSTELREQGLIAEKSRDWFGGIQNPLFVAI
jgi:hypothetical protein